MADWHLYTAEGAQGPYSESQVREWLAAGQLTGAWNVWREGLTDWQLISNTPEFCLSIQVESAIATGPSPALAAVETTPATLPVSSTPEPERTVSPVTVRPQAATATAVATAVRRTATRPSSPLPAAAVPMTAGDNDLNTIATGIKYSLWNFIPVVGGLIYLYLVVQQLHRDQSPWLPMIGWIVAWLVPGVNLAAALYFLYLCYARIGGRFLVGTFIPQIVAGVLLMLVLR